MNYENQKLLTGIAGLALMGSVVAAGWREHQISERYREGALLASLPRPLSPAEREGQTIYHERQCALCHGINGMGGVTNYNMRGDGKMSVLRDVARNFTRAEAADLILNQGPAADRQNPSLPAPPVAMPKYGASLTAQELERLLDFLWALHVE